MQRNVFSSFTYLICYRCRETSGKSASHQAENVPLESPLKVEFYDVQIDVGLLEAPACSTNVARDGQASPTECGETLLHYQRHT